LPRFLSELDEAGYDINWQVLNSKDFGVPQNRERVFIIGNLRSRGAREVLPITGENAATLKQIVAGCQGERVYDIDGLACTLTSCGGGGGAKTGLYFIDQSTQKTQLTEEARCITSRYTAGIVNRTAMNSAVLEVHPILTPERQEKRQNGRRMKDDGEPMFTLTGVDRHGVVIGDGSKNVKIRRLTPKECFRLQGFPDDLFEKARTVNSDAQLYKQAGNAITVNVAYAIGVAVKNAENT
jgi:DNA (cytosine-5)-methyltransferase 1